MALQFSFTCSGSIAYVLLFSASMIKFSVCRANKRSDVTYHARHLDLACIQRQVQWGVSLQPWSSSAFLVAPSESVFQCPSFCAFCPVAWLPDCFLVTGQVVALRRLHSPFYLDQRFHRDHHYCPSSMYFLLGHTHRWFDACLRSIAPFVQARARDPMIDDQCFCMDYTKTLTMFVVRRSDSKSILTAVGESSVCFNEHTKRKVQRFAHD